MTSHIRGVGALLTLMAGLSLLTPPQTATAAGGPSMIVGNVTSQPIGHYEFCKAHPTDCELRSAAVKAPHVTDYGWQIVQDVNEAVNFAIAPKTDFEMHGQEELWSYPLTEGDCEDYALLKRFMLMERGFSAADLLMTVVRKPDGEGHAVLTLRTAEGDYVLDNLTDDVVLWTDTDYIFLKRQASFHTGRWVSIENGAEVLVGALE